MKTVTRSEYDALPEWNYQAPYDDIIGKKYRCRDWSNVSVSESYFIVTMKENEIDLESVHLIED